LGPLAVLPNLRGKGCGKALVEEGLRRAGLGKWRLILVSGEADYYPKFGFVPARDYGLEWPGFIEAERLQLFELSDGVLASLPKGSLPVAAIG
jgi:putative acetyltransferase